MPYIKPEKRPRLDELIDLFPFGALDEGEMDYVISRMMQMWMGTLSYRRIALATSILEDVKQELYRRVAVPYENAKLAENGDVY